MSSSFSAAPSTCGSASCARPRVDKQIPWQAKALGISDDEVINKVMLKETVGGEFTTVQDVAEVALLFAGFGSNALTGESLVFRHGMVHAVAKYPG